MFSQFLQVAYLVQCRRTNGEKTFYSVRLRRQQNVKIGISASRSCSDGKEMLITLVNPNPNPNASLNPSRAFYWHPILSFWVILGNSWMLTFCSWTPNSVLSNTPKWKIHSNKQNAVHSMSHLKDLLSLLVMHCRHFRISWHTVDSIVLSESPFSCKIISFKSSIHI